MLSTRPLTPPPADRAMIAQVITRSLRSWRSARDEGKATQPHLFRALERKGWAVLVPVMDSLFHFYEAAIGRKLKVGQTHRMSSDEGLLIDVVSIARPCRGILGCDAERALRLDCALCSARIMLSLALKDQTAA